YRHWRIVLPGDGDGCGLGGTRAIVVGDGVSEAVGRALARSQVLEGTVGAVAEGAIGVVHDTAERTGGVHREAVRVAGIDVAVVSVERNTRAVFVCTCGDGN